MSLVLRLLSFLILKDSVTGHKQVKSYFLHERIIEAPNQPANGIDTMVGNCSGDILGEGLCQSAWGSVDIYYWPEPDADTSCLSIINKATTPLLQDATIEAVTSGGNMSMTTYWGCAARQSSPNISYIITTAAISTIGNFSFKVSYYNPWSPGPCSGRASASDSFKISSEAHGLHASLNVRAHSIIAPSNSTHTSSFHGGTVTSGSYTFTSPSIYANFHAVTLNGFGAEPQCSIPISMLTFTPGEMSTVAGYPVRADEYTITKSYNFGDLPCPPQQVMEEHWYSPQPGVPYQPLIAMPQQIVDIQPMLSKCAIAFFTGYDPPRTLAPAIAMAPVVTMNTPQISPPAPTPSPTQDPGPPNTAADDNAAASTAVDDPSPPRTQGPILPEQTDVAGKDPGLSWSIGDPVSDDNPQPYHPGNSEGPGQGSVPSSNVEEDDPDQDHEPESPNTGVATIRNPTESSDNTVDPQNYAIALGSQKPGSATTVNGEIAEPLGNGISIAGFTIRPDAAPITADGTWMFLGSSALVVGSVSVDIVLPPVSLAPGQATEMNGQLIQPLTNGLSIAGQTLIPGAAPITISGTPIFLGPSSLKIGSSSIAITLPRQSLISGQVTTINGQVIQPLTDGGIAIAGQTLTPGATPITISGTPMSLGSSSLIIGSSSIAITLPRQSWIPGQVTTINGQALQPLSNGGILIDGTTLTPGALPITVSGTPISLGSAALFIGSSTVPLNSEVPEQIVTTVAGQAVTVDPTAVEVGSLTLTPGGPGTSLSGTLVSLNSDGELMVGTRMIPLETTAGALGGLIMGGLGPGGPYATSLAGVGNVSGSGNGTAIGNGVQVFEGRGESSKSSSLWQLTMVVLFTALLSLF